MQALIMTENADRTMEGFPCSTTEKTNGEPTYHTVKEIERKLIKNAPSFPSELGGGEHGYLGVALTPTKCNLVTGHVSTPQPNPGSISTFPDNPTQPQIARISTTHKEKLRSWMQQYTIIKALKK